MSSLIYSGLRKPLRDGAGEIPVLGFGTLIADPIETRNATQDALQAGEALAMGFAAGRISRQDLFITTKLWNTNNRPERVESAFTTSLERLALAYLDLYLIHTPYAFQPGPLEDRVILNIAAKLGRTPS
jgi:alcohol dehydrogenase (NADP+)